MYRVLLGTVESGRGESGYGYGTFDISAYSKYSITTDNIFCVLAGASMMSSDGGANSGHSFSLGDAVVSISNNLLTVGAPRAGETRTWEEGTNRQAWIDTSVDVYLVYTA